MTTATGMVPNTFTIEPFDPTSTNLSLAFEAKGSFSNFFMIKHFYEARVPYLLHYIESTSFDVLCDRLALQSPFESNYDGHHFTRILRSSTA